MKTKTGICFFTAGQFGKNQTRGLDCNINTTLSEGSLFELPALRSLFESFIYGMTFHWSSHEQPTTQIFFSPKIKCLSIVYR